jgi:hypothetical protein
MYLAIGVMAPSTTNGASRRGWLIHEVFEDHTTQYRGFVDAEGATNTVLLRRRVPGVQELCNLVPVTASYYRERAREAFPLDD